LGRRIKYDLGMMKIDTYHSQREGDREENTWRMGLASLALAIFLFHILETR